MNRVIQLEISETYLDSKGNPDIKERIERLEQELLERVIWRLVEQDGISEEDARVLRLEFLRFFSLAFVTDAVISPSPLVDKFWHAFILHTKDYEAFCQRHLGKFLHHEPKDHTRPAERAADPAPGTFTKGLIEEMYPSHNQQVWAELAICSNSHCDTHACLRM